MINVKDELLRVDGVSDINYQGQRDYSIRAWLDPQKLAARNMTAIDVANAIRNQNLDAPAGQIGQPPVALGPVVSVADRHAGPAHRRRSSSATSSSRSARRRPPAPSSEPMPPCRRVGDGRPDSAASSGRAQRQSADDRRAPTSGSYDRPAAPRPADHGDHADDRQRGTTSGGGGTTGGGDDRRRRHHAAAAARPAAATTGGSRTGRQPSTGTVASTSGIEPAAPVGAAACSAARRWAAARAGRRPASSASATWPASSSAPRTTTSPAPSTASRPSASASTSSPAPTPSTSPTRVRAKMEELKTRFPDGVDYDIGYDTTPFIRESIDDVVKTLLEAVVLVGARRAAVPAGLAGDDPADDRRARLPHRHLRRHGRRWASA